MTATRDDLCGDLTALTDELVRAFDFFNAKFWEGKLVRPVFGFHPNPPNGHKLGHYWPGKWRKVKGKKEKMADEIVFYADLCLKEGMAQVLQTLLHEMVHLWQAMFGKPGKNNFHNKEWHAEMARVGLKTDPKDRVGYTYSTPAFEKLLKEFKPKEDGIPFRTGHYFAPKPVKPKGGGEGGGEGGDGEGGEGEGGGKVGKMKPWRCQCKKENGKPKFTIRVAVPYLNAQCLDCESPFALVE